MRFFERGRILTASLLIVISLFGIVAGFYYLGTPLGQAGAQTAPSKKSAEAPEQAGQSANTAVNTPFANDQDVPFISRLLDKGGNDPDAGLGLRTAEILIRLFLAVILSAILAFRPRKDVPLFKRSLFVSQTQILLAVVAAALMMIVGDNVGRAFAIFAAASLVRFRTNIRDPKEITVLLISLALGLAAGVGRWELGICLSLFALALLWLLELNESEQIFRSMEISVKTRNPDRTQEILTKIFRRMKIDAEVREIEPPDEKHKIGSINYYVNLRLKLTTDKLTERIHAADPENIEGIQWSQKKSATDIYQ